MSIKITLDNVAQTTPPVPGPTNTLLGNNVLIEIVIAEEFTMANILSYVNSGELIVKITEIIVFTNAFNSSYALFKKGSGTYNASNPILETDLIFISIDNVNNDEVFADAWGIGGMYIRAYATNYPILDERYNAPADTLLLDNADITYARKDAVCADKNGNIVILKGTAAEIVTEPTIDFDLYYLIRILLIPAGATEPVDPNTNEGNTNEDIWFAEVGTEVGGESNFATNNGSIAITSNNPLSETKSIEGTTIGFFDRIDLIRGTPVNTVDFTHIRFKIKLKSKTISLLYWRFSFYDSVKNRYYHFSIKNGQYGYSSSSLLEQQISIPLADTTLQNISFDKISFYLATKGIAMSGYWIDDFILVSGFTTNSNVEKKYTSQFINNGDDGINKFISALDLGDVIKNATDIYNTPKIKYNISLTQVDYDAIVTKDANTLYFIPLIP